jgi:hypothetical protein
MLTKKQLYMTLIVGLSGLSLTNYMQSASSRKLVRVCKMLWNEKYFKVALATGSLGGAYYAYWAYRLRHVPRQTTWILPVEVTDLKSPFGPFMKQTDDELITIEKHRFGRCMRRVRPRNEKRGAQIAEIPRYYRHIEQAAAARFLQTVPGYNPKNGVYFGECLGYEVYMNRDVYRGVLEAAVSNDNASVEFVNPQESQRLGKAKNNSGVLVVGLSRFAILMDLVLQERSVEAGNKRVGYVLRRERNGYWRSQLGKYLMDPTREIIVTDKISLH